MMNDEEKARAFVDAQQWVFAKTMADIPNFFLFVSMCILRVGQHSTSFLHLKFVF